MTGRWHTAAELAALRLPLVPTTKRRVNDLARREGWQNAADTAGKPLARRRKHNGGGWEYHYSLLPGAAQAALVSRETEGGGAPTPARRSPPKELWAVFDRLSGARQAKARQRLDLLDAVGAMVRGGVAKNVAVSMVASRNGVGSSTLYSWFDRVAGLDRGDWLPALAPRHTGSVATAACDPRAWDFIKSDYLRLSQPPFTACYERLQEAASEHGWTIPSAPTLRRRIEREIPAAMATLARQGTEALKRLYPAQERDRTMFHAMEAVNADGHKADVFVDWPGEAKPVRPVVLAIQDLFSNKIVGWRVGLTESAHLVQLAFGDVFRDFGIPDYAWLDNGRGFASKWLTGQQPTRFRFKIKPADPAGVLTQLGVQVHWTTPYSGQSKPIERSFGDVCNHIWKHPAFEGAYTGNRPDAKPENYQSKAVPLDRFLEIVGKGIEAHNVRKGRRTRVCGGALSFEEAFRASYESAPIRQARPEHLRLCLMAAESVTARQPAGALHVLGNRYWADFLTAEVGRKLIVRFDPDDLVAGVDVYRLDGSRLGSAECWEAAGFADVDAAREHTRARRKWSRAYRDMAAAEIAMSAAEVAAMLPTPEPEEPPTPSVVRPFFGGAAPQAAVAADTDFDFDEAFSNGLRLVDSNQADT